MCTFIHKQLQVTKASLNNSYYCSQQIVFILKLRFSFCTKQNAALQQESLTRNRESQLEAKIKILEEERSDLGIKGEELEKQMLQLEKVLVSDIQQLTNLHILIFI